jgi:GNAT superfamily N-acetyltransferase
MMKSEPVIRRYKKSDGERVGILIAETYGDFNLPEMEPGKRAAMLGPFAFANSSRQEHRDAIAQAIEAPSVWVAEADGEIAGVLRGGRTDHLGRTVLSSLFVDGKYHRQGIGRALVERFEAEYLAKGARIFKLSATLFAVPFYLSAGYKKSTGVRCMHSFEEDGLPYQPMKKVVPKLAG